MLYIVRRADFEVEDNVNSSNPVYMFCNTVTGTLHFRRKSELQSYGSPIIGVGKEGLVTELGDVKVLTYILAQLNLSGLVPKLGNEGTTFSFYTSQLFVTLHFHKILMHGYSVYPVFKTREVRENADNTLYLPISWATSPKGWSWDCFNDDARRYSKVVVDAFFDVNSHGCPSCISEVHIKNIEPINGDVLLYPDLFCEQPFYDVHDRADKLKIFLYGDNLNLVYELFMIKKLFVHRLEVYLIGNNTTFSVESNIVAEEAITGFYWKDYCGERISVYSEKIRCVGVNTAAESGMTWEWHNINEAIL